MHIEIISYSVCAIAYLVLFAVLITDGHRGLTKQLFLAASFASSLWAIAVVLNSVFQINIKLALSSEAAKDALWLALIINMLMERRLSDEFLSSIKRRYAKIVLAVAAAIGISVFLLKLFAEESGMSIPVFLLLAVIGIVLVEQLYKNSPEEQRWALKFLCLGLLGSYIFNFYMYSDALLYQRIDPILWKTRGFVEASLLSLLAISISRDPLWSPRIFISRRIVFHTTTLLVSAIYLLLMGAAGYYVGVYGGTWGSVIQAFFVFTALMALMVVLVSRRIRARVRVFVNKHFYPYKYDYRDEWLRFINTISFGEDPLYLKTVKSISQIIDSPGGMLWLKKDNGFFECVQTYEMAIIDDKEPSESSMARFMAENEFVISVDEFKSHPEVYHRLGNLELPAWLEEIDAWLVVPLIYIDSLTGFIILDHAKAQKKHFNWEDSDLLKTAARQVASYIEQQRASISLAEAKQFESFNKISTYVVHDIKNLVAQLSLIVSNAEKHKHNPLFMDDVIGTVNNTVQKMNKMLDTVTNKSRQGSSIKIDVIVLLQELIRMREQSNVKPVPVLGCESKCCFVKADKDQLLSIFGHMLQNAQDATPEDGDIRIIQSIEIDQVVIKFRDTGIGMDEDFIKHNLFKPFKSTKGKGMGIGVYETREIVHALGGSIEVESVPSKGTCFTIRLPLFV